MYSYIKGELVEIAEDLIVVEANNIGYNIHVPGQVLSYLPERGSDVKIYTYLYIREDAMMLYGFLTRDDLNVFKLLLGVSGIGPKGALAILSVMTTDDLRFAVLGDDEKTIAKAPGIGAKTAKRLILELKDTFESALEHNGESGSVPGQGTNAVKNEAVQALTALGYSSSEALKALQNVEITDGMDVETVLKQALKQMAFL